MKASSTRWILTANINTSTNCGRLATPRGEFGRDTQLLAGSPGARDRGYWLGGVMAHTQPGGSRRGCDLLRARLGSAERIGALADHRTGKGGSRRYLRS